MRAFTSFVLTALVAAPALAAPIVPGLGGGPMAVPTTIFGTPIVVARQGGLVQNLESSTDASTSASAPTATASANAFNIRPGFGPGPVILPREPPRPVSFIPLSALQGAQGKRQLNRDSFIKPFDGPIGQGPAVPNSKRQLQGDRPASGAVLSKQLHPNGGPVALDQRQEAVAGEESTAASGATATEAASTTATGAAGATATEAAATTIGTEAAGATTGAIATATAGGAEATAPATVTGTESAGGAEASGTATTPEASASGAAVASGTASGEAPAASGAAPTAGGEGAGGLPGRPYGGKGQGRMYGFMEDGSVVPMGYAPA